MQRTTKAPKKSNSNVKVIILVSLFWIVVAATVLAFIQNGNAKYNQGIFDGMSRTKVILQSK